MFFDKKSAQQALDSLKLIPSITAATLTMADGRTIASLRRNLATPLPPQWPLSWEIHVDQLVAIDNDRLGNLTIRADLSDVWLGLVADLVFLAWC